MGKRQRSRETGWGKFHATQKVLDAAPEAGGQWASGRDGRLVHSRCNITSRFKTRQEQILGLRECYGRTSGVECHPVRTKPSKDRRITILGYAQASGPSRKHCYVNELLTHYTRSNRHTGSAYPCAGMRGHP